MGCKNRLEELNWLMNEIERRVENQMQFSEYDYTTQGKFNNQIIFLYKNCNPIANSIVPVVDYEGMMMGILDSEKAQEEIVGELVI